MDDDILIGSFHAHFLGTELGYIHHYLADGKMENPIRAPDE